MTDSAVRWGVLRAAAVAGGFTLGACALARIPAPAALRAAGMLALPCLLLAVLRREARRLEQARGRARARSAMRTAPAAPPRRQP